MMVKLVLFGNCDSLNCSKLAGNVILVTVDEIVCSALLTDVLFKFGNHLAKSRIVVVISLEQN